MNGNKRHLISLGLIAVLLLLAGCVYYNTFYNARKAFNEAEKVRRDTRYKTVRLNVSKYNLAIEKSLKVIENHPNSSWYDDALFVLAVSYYYTDKFSNAERRFRELLANYGESEFAPESELYLAKAKLKLNDEEDAMVIFEQIFDSDADRDYKAEAAMALGTYHFDNKNDVESQRFFQAVRDSLGTAEERKIAQRYIADSHFRMYRFQDALGSYLQILGMEPGTEQKYHAISSAAQCSFQLLRIDDGLDYLNTLIEDELYYDSVGVLKLRLAEGYEIDDDIYRAEVLYQEVADESANKKIQAQANYRLGLIYQFDYDDLAEAKKFYDKTVELSRSSEYGRDAIQRSSDIGKLDEYARTIAIDSSTSQELIDEAAFTQYQLAELYWFNLDKPDSAILEMRYLVDSFPQSFEAPKAGIALAQMCRDYLADTAMADSMLREVIAKYPHSDFLPEALEQLDLKGTDSDTGYAELYLRRAENQFLDSGNVDAARENYQYIVDNYPDSRYYLQARFSLIWLTEEYESPGDSSLIFAYTALADSFPDTYWAKQATSRTDYRPPTPEQDEDVLDSTALDDEAARDDQYAGESGAEEDTTTYLNPLEQVTIGPDGERIPDLRYNPIEIREPFEYPTEAYREAWEGTLYFQILLDFSGEVIDYTLKIRSPSEDINREASEAVESMTFNVLDIPAELQGSWFVYKYKVKKPDHLR